MYVLTYIRRSYNIKSHGESIFGCTMIYTITDIRLCLLYQSLGALWFIPLLIYNSAYCINLWVHYDLYQYWYTTLPIVSIFGCSMIYITTDIRLCLLYQSLGAVWFIPLLIYDSAYCINVDKNTLILPTYHAIACIKQFRHSAVLLTESGPIRP